MIPKIDADPYAEGHDARLAGRPETANPYDPINDSEAHLSWNDGWSQEDVEDD
jgi:hypothetical protein